TDARQLRGTSYPGSISVTDGARSASTDPEPVEGPTHCVGIAVGSAAKRVQSGSGTAAPTHDSTSVLPGSPAPADASASRLGRSRSRNSPTPPRSTPMVLR